MYRFVLLALFAAATFAQTPSTQNPPQSAVPMATIDGRVTNEQTGEGIGGAKVRFVPIVANSPGLSERTASTQPDGTFHLENVMPGTYIVIASQDGFIPNRVSSGRPTAVTVEAGQQVGGISIQLNPAAIVSGAVFDGDGKPVSQAVVAAFRVRSFRGKSQLRAAGGANTDKSGKYRLTHLEPGTYYIVAGPTAVLSNASLVSREALRARAGAKTREPQLQLVRTFYPRAINLDDATPVQVTAGQDVTGINITLVRSASYSIRGRINGFSDLIPRRTTVMLSLRNGINAAGLNRTVRPNNEGVFEIDGVVPGSYTLWLRGVYANTAPNPMVHPRPRIIGRQDLDLGNADIRNLELAVLQPPTLTGRVMLDESNNANVNLSQVRVVLSTLEDIPGRSMWRTETASDGSFSFSDLEPARYALTAMNAPAGTYVKSISFNKQDVTHTGIDLTEAESGQIDIVLRKGAGEVDGTIQANQGQAAAPAIVVLIPETLGPDGASGLFFSAARPGDNFAIRNVPPGNYYAVAVEHYDPTAWQNTDFIREMEAEGTSVEVDENSHAQVQLSVVTADQLRQAAARLGLNF